MAIPEIITKCLISVTCIILAYFKIWCYAFNIQRIEYNIHIIVIISIWNDITRWVTWFWFSEFPWLLMNWWVLFNSKCELSASAKINHFLWIGTVFVCFLYNFTKLIFWSSSGKWVIEIQWATNSQREPNIKCLLIYSRFRGGKWLKSL